MDKFVVVDLETTGHTPARGDQIIEIGMVKVVNFKIVDQYKTYVKPDHDIPTFITNLTGITNEQVAKAPQFKEIAGDILAFCGKDSYFVGHHVEFDLGFLNYALQEHGMNPISNRILDTVELARILVPRAPGYKLSQLAEFFHIEHINPHRALSDAYVTAEILIKLLEKAGELPAETLEHLYKLSGKLKSDLSFIVSEILTQKRFSIEEYEGLEVYRGLAIKKQDKISKPERDQSLAFGDFLDDVFHEEGSLKGHLQQFEMRPGQRKMSEIIYDAFIQSKHALIEAETGTGKTLAYLIPALYFAISEQTKVVVSTFTTQLQSQILDKEIPLLKKVFPIPFKTALLKGKRHYLSLNKFEQELLKPIEEDNYDIVLTKAMILVWITETETGDVDEIQLPSSGKIFWRKINAEADIHLNPSSPWFSKTYYQRAKEKAQKADIIITNHALLCTDLNHDFQLLPAYQYAIIDEAHHLEKSASRHFGMQTDYVSIQYLLNGLSELNIIQGKIWESLQQKILNGKEYADDLFRYLYQIVCESHEKNVTFNDVGRLQYVFEHDQLKSMSELHELADRFLLTLKEIQGMLQQLADELSEHNQELMDEIELKQDELASLLKSIEFFLLNHDDKQVKWIEIEASGAKNAVFLYSEPISVAPLLQESFFSQKESVILTSATLTMNDSFLYITERLGLGHDVLSEKIPSPFLYGRQVKLMVPNDLPHIKYDSGESFIQGISESIYRLARITRGRMLVLFTSYNMLKTTYRNLKSMMNDNEFVLIAQGISSGSRSRLKKNFQAFDNAILFGTSSFWEGVDIPGDDLTSLVIVRLPFDPPDHPVYQAKSESLKEAGKNPFMDLALPNAVIRFKQGFGRLIRSSTDKGIVFVLDQRIIRSRYGKYFLRSIPEVPVLYDGIHNLLQEVKDWL